MTITVNIGSAGRDYATLQAAWNATPATWLDNYEFVLYADSEFSAGLDTLASAKTVGEFTTLIRSAAGSGIADHASAGTNALRYDASKGAAISANLFLGFVLNISVPNVSIEGLQIKNTGSQGGAVRFDRPSTINGSLSGCVLDAAYAGNAVVIGCKSMTDCLVVQRADGLGSYSSYGASTIRNNTYICTGSNTRVGIKVEYGGPSTAIGNTVLGFQTPFQAASTTLVAASDYNATDAASIAGMGSATHNLTGLAIADQIVDPSYATLDANPKAGAGIIGAGVYFAGAGADILGRARSATTPTIGAREFSAGTTPAISAATASPTGGTTADIGCTTDTASGALWALVRIGGSPAADTAIEAGGQTVAVSTTTPSIAYIGLTAATGYSVDIVQKVSGVYSNVLTTTFTTDNTGSGGGELAAILTGVAAVGILSTAGAIAINSATVLSGTALIRGFAAAGALTGGAVSVLSGTAEIVRLQASGTITSAAPSTLLGAAVLGGVAAGGAIVSLAPAVLSGAAALGRLTAAGTLTGGAASVLSGTAVLGRVISAGALQGLVSIDSAAPTGYYRRNARKIRSGQARSDGAEVMLAIGARRRR